ncbi:MAG: 2-oxoacid:acceptor oxidoreductase family protein [Candidatus Thermoplasmatota archaeon]|nr:2-oxoacid:acceptor oxidoreductase family protein [Candidatus Thermoplasmatota archaeon]
MYEVRFHGRGGQGAVTAANILALAASKQNYYVQAFPMFGVERRGAPVTAFLRFDTEPIELRSQIYEPDTVVVLDPTLISVVDVAKGLRENGNAVINTARNLEDFHLHATVYVVDATAIALNSKLGTRTNPIVNTAMLGAYAKAIGNIKLESIIEAIGESISARKSENIEAAKKAFRSVKK